MADITVEGLSKNFRVRRPAAKGQAKAGALARLLAPRPVVELPAVSSISFAVAAGERVAFIGPNGAGKSTTLKMLTGILRPSAGHAEVAGCVPWQQRRQLARRIGIVFGQRSQLWYTLPVRSSFELLRRIYDVDRARHRARLERLALTFEIGGLLDRPVSELSLGQRIRCEIAASLLHGPGLLLLDEPTIGLDVTAKAALRDHLGELSRAEGTTVLLTSHDTGDIETICDRVIVIDRGRLLLDQPLERLRREFLQHRAMTLVTAEEHPHLDIPGVAVATAEPYRLSLSVDTARMPVEKVVAAALAQLSLRDIVIENPPLEEVIKAIYRDGIGQKEISHATG